MCQTVFPWNPGFASQTMFPMSMQSMMPMGPACCIPPQMQATSIASPQSFGAMPFGAFLSEEAQQEQVKSFLSNQRQQLIQTKKFLEEQQKTLDESIATIDSQLSRLSKKESETKKPVK